MKFWKPGCHSEFTCININFHFIDLFSKHTNPAVEILKSQKRKLTVLQIFLHYISIGQWSCNRSPRCKYNTPTVILLLHNAYLFIHITAFCAPRGWNPQNFAYFSFNRQIFIVVRLINKKRVYPQILKIYCVTYVIGSIFEFFNGLG